MKVSVIIPTKNPGSIFRKVLDMVMKQRTPWEYEVLVIDSESSDETVEFVKSVSGVRLHCIKSEEFGHGRTRNLGISMTSGEYVVLITHDALPAHDLWLVELVKAVEQAPDIAGAFGRHKAYDRDGPYIYRDLEAHFDGFKNKSHVVRMEDKSHYDNDIGYRQFLHFFSDNNSCLRRSIWEEIPYPDVDFAEDQIWAKLIIENGYAKAYADKALVYHSHQFGFWETCRRSFDESQAFKKLFGYKLCPTLVQLIGQFIRMTWSDWKYSKRTVGILKDLPWMLRSPMRNLFRQIGYFLGQRADLLPSGLEKFFSRDKRIKDMGS